LAIEQPLWKKRNDSGKKKNQVRAELQTKKDSLRAPPRLRGHETIQRGKENGYGEAATVTTYADVSDLGQGGRVEGITTNCFIKIAAVPSHAGIPSSLLHYLEGGVTKNASRRFQKLFKKGWWNILEDTSTTSKGEGLRGETDPGLAVIKDDRKAILKMCKKGREKGACSMGG